ncbi:MAG TPA: hypothetical protein PK863_02590 [Candidatus Dojkabacteria bacterium]|nr:hypothetical protein [Candidatus Dojkabacteria bacterium]HRP37093.1 hypothetical protein [Candidatus Dojkabacteria bacterium]HRP51480.1 hypothetical protein [Candidatus Dojkabacteria bacterium]
MIRAQFRFYNDIEGRQDWWSADGTEPPDAGKHFGEPPNEKENYEYEIGPHDEGKYAGHDGVFQSGDIDEEPIRHSKN